MPPYRPRRRTQQQTRGGRGRVRGRGQYPLSAFLGDPQTRLAAIVEVDQAIGDTRQQAIAERQGWKPELFRDMREAFHDASIDILATGTPNH